MSSSLDATFGLGYTLGGNDGWINDEVAEFFADVAEGFDVEDVLWKTGYDSEEEWDLYWEARKNLQAKSCLALEFSGLAAYDYVDYHLLHRESVSVLLSNYGPLPDISRYSHLTQSWKDKMLTELLDIGFPVSALPEAEWLCLLGYG
jgi:hypothetical protein